MTGTLYFPAGEATKDDLFLMALEALLTQHYGDEWSYNFDDEDDFREIVLTIWPITKTDEEDN